MPCPGARPSAPLRPAGSAPAPETSSLQPGAFADSSTVAPPSLAAPLSTAARGRRSSRASTCSCRCWTTLRATNTALNLTSPRAEVNAKVCRPKCGSRAESVAQNGAPWGGLAVAVRRHASAASRQDEVMMSSSLWARACGGVHTWERRVLTGRSEGFQNRCTVRLGVSYCPRHKAPAPASASRKS